MADQLLNDAPVQRSAALAAIERIGRSTVFRRSLRHRRLLTFLVEQVLAQDTSRLKEIVLAVEFFGRDTRDFDPKRDPVVRVEARRLREKLARYYRGEGADDPVEISIPTGNYVPTIAWRGRGAREDLPSIVVLPFLNVSGDPAQDSLCDGLTDDVTDALARVPALRVVARTSAYQFKAQAVDIREIGRALDVQHVLEGSLQRHQGRYKIIAQLNRVADGCHAWSITMDMAAAGDLFDVQEAISRRIVDTLQRRLHDEPPGDSSRRRVSHLTTDAQARDSYYRARYLSRQRSLDGYAKAAELLRETLRIDPDFALAHAALGSALTNYAGFCPKPAAGSMAEAKRAALRALELDSELGEAHAVLATIRYRYELDWVAAEKHHLRALRLAPSVPYVHASYASGLLFHGRVDEAWQERTLAQQLDPLDFAQRPLQALFLLCLRRYAAAEAEFRVALDIDPRNLFSLVLLGINYVCWRKPDLAQPLFEEAERLAPTLPIAQAGIAMVEALRGRRQRARARLKRVLARFERNYIPPYQIAMTWAQLGDRDATLEWLERAARQRDFNFVGLPVDPTFDPVQDDPRFRALLARYDMKRIDVAAA